MTSADIGVHDTNPRIRVLLVEDNPEFLQYVVALARREPMLDIIGTAEDGFQALHCVREVGPDLTVLDIGLPGMNGIEVARHIRRVSPRTKILMLTQERSTDFVEEAFNAGASGYVSKIAVAEDLSAAIVSVSKGTQFLSPCLRQQSGLTPTAQGLAV